MGPEQGSFGFYQEIDPFKTALERYGVWPITVWTVKHDDKETETLKLLVGDIGNVNTLRRYHDVEPSTRLGCFGRAKPSLYRGAVQASVFHPAIASWILNLYAPENGICFDPFSGGGTRAIFAAKRGLQYLGIELREQEVEAVVDRCNKAGLGKLVTIHQADACSDLSKLVDSEIADFCITCPPYFDLERYKGGENDISMLRTYEEFLEKLSIAIKETYRVLKSNAHACWVVGLHRNKCGELLPIHHDLVRLMKEAGFYHKEEIILHHTGTGSLRRVGGFERGRQLLIRVHEYVEVFLKPGKTTKAA